MQKIQPSIQPNLNQAKNTKPFRNPKQNPETHHSNPPDPDSDRHQTSKQPSASLLSL